MMEVKKSFYTAATEHPFDIRELEPVVCDMCGADAYREITVEQGFSIRECRACGLVYVSPQPAASEFEEFYEGFYEGDHDKQAAERSLGHVERHLRNVIRRKRPDGGKFLEIGCGYGRLLRAMEGLPWERTGVELNEDALSFANDHTPGVRFVRGTLDDVDFTDDPQDCIVLVAVLEHVKSPKAALARLRSWLNPGGLLLVQVPYIAPFLRAKRWLPGLPIHFEAPRHLFDFAPPVLRRYLAEAGFEALDIRISRPYGSPTALGAALIWGVKLPGYGLYTLSGGRYIYPYASALLGCAERPK